MGVFDWLMKGIGFEGDEQGYEQAQVLADQKRQVKELKKQNKIEKKLAKEQAKREKLNRKKNKNKVEEPKSGYSFNEAMFNFDSFKQSTFDPDQYNMSSNPQTYGYDSNGYVQGSMGGYGNKNIIFFYPKSYSETQKLIDYLRSGESVMLNLDGISDEEAQRMLDFSSGAVYALSGSIQRVSGNIFLLTPEGLGIIAPKKNMQHDEQN